MWLTFLVINLRCVFMHQSAPISERLRSTTRTLAGTLCLALLSTGHALAFDAVIERDSFGVPHIYGKTDADMAFGLAYAQAEDGWEILEESLPYYRGQAAEFFGKDAAATDYLVKWLGFWTVIERDYDALLKPETKRYLDAFAAGFNTFAAAHPERVTLDVLPVTPQDVIAAHMLRHPLFYGFERSISALRAETRQFEVSEPPLLPKTAITLGSNATAVAPSRTENGSTLLMINSHQPLTGPVSWYEAHLQSGEGLNVMGGLFIGAPALGVGFSEHHGWGATVNQPDLVDIFVLDMDLDDENRYRLDGAWRDLEQIDIPIKVLLWGWLPWTVHETGYRSVHGPVMKTDHGTYAVRYAGMDEIRQVEQWLAMSAAKSFDEWRAAIGMQHIASFNFVYANADGVIHFIHNAMMPRRVPGWRWDQYLPGNRSELIWEEYLAPEELPRMTNPTSGFLHSANQSPFQVSSEGSNPKASDYPVESGWPTRMTNRAVRGLELLEANKEISAAHFNDMKYDNAYSPHYRGYRYLASVAQLDPNTAEEAIAIQLIKDWDLRTDKANRHAALGVCIFLEEWHAERADKAPPAPRLALNNCMDSVKGMAGRIDPEWGTLQKHGRNGRVWPVSGGPDTLRAMYAERLEEEDAYLTVTAGDGLYYLIEWTRDGEQLVHGTHQYGSQMTDPSSPHYLDQAEAFSLERTHQAHFPSLAESEIVTRYEVTDAQQPH
jgi:acyl-homoserine-lactone acylase